MTCLRSLEFERTFLELVEEIRINKKLSKLALASVAFKEKDPNKKYHMLLKGDSYAKPQRLNMAESYNLACAIDTPYVTLIVEIERRLAFKMTCVND